MFIRKYCNWVEFRQLPGVWEIDFHNDGNEYTGSYWENMKEVWNDTLNALKIAQEQGIQYVLFTHGHSTSHRGVTTSRSQVRSVMRSKEATPFIIRKECIQHYSVFVAKIRLPKNDTKTVSDKKLKKKE